MKRILLKDLLVTTTSHNAAGKKRQIIGPGEIDSLYQFAQVAFTPGEIAREHKHDDMYEVFLVEDGKGTIKINGEVYPFIKGMCVVVEPGELHEVQNTGKENLVLTYFNIKR